MDLSSLLPLVIFGGGFSLVGGVLYGAWMLGRYRGREESTPMEIEDFKIRLARLEDATTRVASSIDRLEAAHRMTARLLTDTALPLKPPAHAITPH